MLAGLQGVRQDKGSRWHMTQVRMRRALVCLAGHFQVFLSWTSVHQSMV
jgi:hypothetical protein